MANGYLSQEVSLSSTGISLPEGYESVFLSAFFLIVPYVVGFLFLFLFVSKFDFDLLEVVKNAEGSIFVSWLVGYEIVSIFTLVFILFKFISYRPNEYKSKTNRYNSSSNRHVNRYNSSSNRHVNRYNSSKGNSIKNKKNIKFPIKR